MYVTILAQIFTFEQSSFNKVTEHLTKECVCLRVVMEYYPVFLIIRITDNIRILAGIIRIIRILTGLWKIYNSNYMYIVFFLLLIGFSLVWRGFFEDYKKNFIRQVASVVYKQLILFIVFSRELASGVATSFSFLLRKQLTLQAPITNCA